ncbi:hypothetical protein BC628DRAFT_1419673 [Trametes gibbosa]|nr:hypothetical protein BC628DRAFT_1419673 [Trametes gibbosa]
MSPKNRYSEKDQPPDAKPSIPTQALRAALSHFRFDDKSTPSLRRSPRNNGEPPKLEEEESELSTLPFKAGSSRKRSAAAANRDFKRIKVKAAREKVSIAPTENAQAAELAKAEFTAGVPDLLRKIALTRPRILCFVGKQIWESFVKAAAPRPDSREHPGSISVASPTSVESIAYTNEPSTKLLDGVLTPKGLAFSKRTGRKKRPLALPKPVFAYGLQPYKVVHADPTARTRETLFFVVVSTSGLVAGFQPVICTLPPTINPMIFLPVPVAAGASLTITDGPHNDSDSGSPSKDATQILRFPSPFTFILSNPVPLVELRLQRFARTIRDKPRWWENVYNAEIIARWTQEIIEHDRYVASQRDEEDGTAETTIPMRHEHPLRPFEYAASQAYQWLPTDFAVSDAGRVVPQGYINSLHPTEHANSYRTISSILERFMPMFERVIEDQLSPPRAPIFPIDPEMWYTHPEAQWPENIQPGPELYQWECLHHWPQIPDAVPFQPTRREGRVSLGLKGRTIQVVVKMANIVLTPAALSYPGGAWHVEGMANEKIVATGLYYYDSANITESRLSFRAAVGDGKCNGATYLTYEAWDHRGFLTVYGITDGLSLNEELGHIVAVEDKCVVFPNIYQHRVSPFELADSSRGGHRKILAFFLVDPLTRVHSTSDVPPQQAQWYRSAVNSSDIFKRLPTELVELILEYVSESTVTLEEAQVDREMLERARFVKTHNEELFEAEFSMCEH